MDLLNLIAENVVLVVCGGSAVVFLGAFLLGRWLARPTASHKRIQEAGMTAPARVLKARQLNVRINGVPMTGLTLEVHPDGAEPYQVEARQVVPYIHMPRVQPGEVVIVKYHPDNPREVVLELEET